MIYYSLWLVFNASVPCYFKSVDVERRGNGLERQKKELLPKQWSDKEGLEFLGARKITSENISGKSFPNSHKNKMRKGKIY